MIVCPRCGSPHVRVAGRLQCPDCNQVIEDCCSGETVGIAAEQLAEWGFPCRGCQRWNYGYGRRPAACAFCGVAA